MTCVIATSAIDDIVEVVKDYSLGQVAYLAGVMLA